MVWYHVCSYIDKPSFCAISMQKLKHWVSWSISMMKVSFLTFHLLQYTMDHCNVECWFETSNILIVLPNVYGSLNFKVIWKLSSNFRLISLLVLFCLPLKLYNSARCCNEMRETSDQVVKVAGVHLITLNFAVGFVYCLNRVQVWELMRHS